MDSPSKGEYSKGVISKMWKRCKTLKKGGSLVKSKSLPLNIDQYKVAPKAKGCFPIYVGPEKERFMIKTEHVNHHLFKILLEEAESEYGYCHEGPLMLPCQVDQFVDVLMEMDYYSCDQQNPREIKGCNFVARSTNSSSYHFCTPPRVIALAR